MRRVSTVLAILAISLGASLTTKADVRVRGYSRSNGTYVQPHWRSNPDGNFRNNWSTYPNVNPYTGAVGTRRTPSDLTTPSYRVPSYNRSTYPDSSPYMGAKGTTRMPNFSGTPSFRTPSYNRSSPNLWDSRSPSSPSLSRPRQDIFGGSLLGK